MKLRPLNDYVIVRRSEEKHVSDGGIIIPDQASEKPDQGEVLSIGMGKFLPNGSRVPMAVNTGDKVLFGKHSGTEIKFNNESILVMRESEIFAILA